MAFTGSKWRIYLITDVEMMSVKPRYVSESFPAIDPMVTITSQMFAFVCNRHISRWLRAIGLTIQSTFWGQS